MGSSSKSFWVQLYCEEKANLEKTLECYVETNKEGIPVIKETRKSK